MTKKTLAKPEGVCALTRRTGRYVASHIIPKALTNLSPSGEMRLEVGLNLPIRKRYDSWYDERLVIRNGEDILSEIDNEAIRYLRLHKLIWSGWEGKRLLEESLEQVEGYGIRSLEISAQTLQLFFLSLLWRAAASSRAEFRDVRLSPDVLEDLRLRILMKQPGDLRDYPVQLVQLTTLGDLHNRTPLLEECELPIEGWAGIKVPYARFYFDGLVARVHLPSPRQLPEDYLKTCMGLGDDDRTLIVCIPYEDSRAFSNLKESIQASAKLERPKLKALALAAKHYANSYRNSIASRPSSI